MEIARHAFNLLSEIEKLSPEYDSILKDIIAILHQSFNTSSFR